MRTLICSLALAVALGGSALAAEKYQVTGPIVKLTDTKIVVEKGKDKERFEISRTSDTKVTGELKVGAKVTIHYSLIAATIEVRE